jgi:hypothetical protein
LSAVYSFVTEADGLPTQGVKDQYADMKRELDRDEAQFKQLTSSDLASLNDAAKKLDAPIVVVSFVPAAQ